MIPTHFTREYDLPSGYRVELTATFGDCRVVELQAAWSPRRPSRKMWKKLQAPYRTARNAFMVELGRAAGAASITCIEAPRGA